MAEEISFSAIGNYRVISYNEPFSCANEFRGWIIETSGENQPSASLFLEFRIKVSI